MRKELNVERLFGGQPLLSPQGSSWESGVTFNAAAVHLALTDENLPAIRALLGRGEEPREIVALHYRARPSEDPGFPFTRSYVGVSVHEPDLTPIRRFEAPVLSPEEPYEALGSEDPRVIRFDDAWWMVYCGVAPLDDPQDPKRTWVGSLCVARSEDLVNWTKCGVAEGLSGDVPGAHSNKDGVLFPDRIDGKAVMLHRPMAGHHRDWGTNLAVADGPAGPYEDLGWVHGPQRNDGYVASWCGAGATPIALGRGRYLSIEHTGNYLPEHRRKYVLDAFLYDFERGDLRRPETLVAARLDDFMRPETEFEVKGPFADSVGNVLFCCGAYVYDGWLYLVYGGGDSFILAARVRLAELLCALEERALVAA